MTSDVESSILNALRMLIAKEPELLDLGVDERSIAHRLGIYIQDEFESWHVDYEYNRKHEDTKTLKIESEDSRTNDTNAKSVFPEIIVHQRSTDSNFIVIEIKKSSNRTSEKYDLAKLHAFKAELGYEHAFFET